MTIKEQVAYMPLIFYFGMWASYFLCARWELTEKARKAVILRLVLALIPVLVAMVMLPAMVISAL